MDAVEPRWRKSSYSRETNCAEVAAWRTSSHSAACGNCLEAGSCSHGVAVRDTKLERSPVLKFSGEAWTAFTASVRTGTVAS